MFGVRVMVKVRHRVRVRHNRVWVRVIINKDKINCNVITLVEVYIHTTLSLTPSQ